jgi:hypothetical protein
MDDLPKLIIDIIWRYYWQEKKEEFLNDIKKRNKFNYNFEFNLYPENYVPSGYINFNRLFFP